MIFKIKGNDSKTSNSALFLGILSLFLFVAIGFDIYFCIITKYNFDYEL